MVDQEHLEKIQKRLGRRIEKLIIYAGYTSIDDFVKAYTARTYRSSIISRYIKGENLSFQSIIKLANTLMMPTRTMMDLGGIEPIIRDEKYKQELEVRLKNEQKAFGANLAKIRDEKEMTLLDIEVSSGINQGQFNNYENGKTAPNFNTMVIICDVFKTPLVSLFPL